MCARSLFTRVIRPAGKCGGDPSFLSFTHQRLRDDSISCLDNKITVVDVVALCRRDCMIVFTDFCWERSHARTRTYTHADTHSHTLKRTQAHTQTSGETNSLPVSAARQHGAHMHLFQGLLSPPAPTGTVARHPPPLPPPPAYLPLCTYVFQCLRGHVYTTDTHVPYSALPVPSASKKDSLPGIAGSRDFLLTQ